VTDSTELKTPENVCLTREPTPLKRPYEPSRGPLTNPVIGLSIKSQIPVPILTTKEIGFPIMLILPITLNKLNNPSRVYLAEIYFRI
jgi:hypothetical protein